MTTQELREETARQIGYTRANLANAARSLADQMGRLSARVESIEDYAPNSLGEVQSRGMEVDRLCAVLAAQREQLALLDYVLRSEA